MAGFLNIGPNTEQWLVEAKDIFSEKSFNQQKYIPSYSIAFRELTRVYKEQISSWWEVQSLDNYIKNNIVPRGLRITLTPAQKNRNPSFFTKWEKEATDSSVRFMRLLLEDEKVNLATLEVRLKEHIDIAKKFEKEGDYSQKEKDLQNTLERYQYNIKDRKHKQFLRDLADFRDNKAYSLITNKSRRDFEADAASSTETDVSESDRETTGRGPKTYKQKGNRGNNKNSTPKGRGKRFTDKRDPYTLRERPPTSGDH